MSKPFVLSTVRNTIWKDIVGKQFKRNFLTNNSAWFFGFEEVSVWYCLQWTKTIFLRHCKNCQTEFYVIQLIQSNTENSNPYIWHRLKFLSSMEIIASRRPRYGNAYSKKKYFCFGHCKHFHMENSPRQKGQFKTKNQLEDFVYDWIFQVLNFFPSDLLPYGNAYSGQVNLFPFTVSVPIWKSIRDEKFNRSEKFTCSFFVFDWISLSDSIFSFGLNSI